jgi:polyhydroxyalkanoate synthesis regulator phasin
MDDVVRIVIALDRKVSQLIDFYEKEKKNVLLLKDTIKRLKEQIKSLETEIEECKESNRKLKLATAFKSKGDASDAKKFIDELVREIDKCVTLLNR